MTRLTFFIEGPALFPFSRKKTKDNSVTGLGLQPEGVAAARVEGDPAQGTPQLRFCDFRATNTLAEQGEALAALARDYDLKDAHCVSVLPSSHVSLLLVEKPNVEASELKTAVRWRVKDLLDFHVDDAVVDVFEVPGQADRGRPPMVYVVAAHQGSVQEHIDLVEGAGCGLDVVDIPEMAQRNIAALLPEDDAGVAVLHLFEHRGLLTLTRQSALYLARNLDTGAAELQGHGDEDGAMPEALEQRLESIVLEVQRSLDYYESHFSMPPIGNLVIAPLPYEVPGMLGYIANQLGVAVRELDLNTLLDVQEPLEPALQARAFAAVGAALRREGSG